MEVKDCKCGFWMNTAYDVCPLKQCKQKELFQDVVLAADSFVKELNEQSEFDESETFVILIDPQEKCILVDQITKV